MTEPTAEDLYLQYMLGWRHAIEQWKSFPPNDCEQRQEAYKRGFADGAKANNDAAKAAAGLYLEGR